jgi:hypothetical protein
MGFSRGPPCYFMLMPKGRPLPTHRVCNRCQESKPLTKEHFHHKHGTLGSLAHTCRPCATIKAREWRQANPVQDKEWRRQWRQRNRTRRRDAETCRTYGVPKGTYIRMLAEQEGKCAICGKVPPGRPLGMDHCHTTGRVRDLLCNHCNSGLGMFGDNSELMLKAIAYLARHAAASSTSESAA